MAIRKESAVKSLQLPDVTLVIVETREHKLASMALEDGLKAATFGDVLVLTDRPDKFGASYANERTFEALPFQLHGQQVRFAHVPDWPDKLGWSRAWWFDVPPLLRTRQTLNVQWDAGIWDASLWRDDWLEYDYIGAVWHWHPTKKVGNGGFSLVSTRLKRYLRKHRKKYQVDIPVDDDLLCRKYRPDLEELGFVWAPESVAEVFSWEGCAAPRTKETHFGFHAMFNWPLVYDKKQLDKRMEVALASPAIANPDSYHFKAFCQANPEIAAKLLKDSGLVDDDLNF